ncbi:MAG: segregation/condensation protein A [Eggerthellaceae bacterium]|nr:segregation/condensation protein A [Eggerthellaceae bacterium]
MSYHVKTNNFEGPFDILLYLVSRQRVDIGTIAIAEIADQYLAEIAKLENLDLDVASDFLLVASTLLELKAASLVPREKDQTDEEIADLTPDEARELLVTRLIEYKKFKNAAHMLDVRAKVQARMHPRPFGPDVEFTTAMPDFLRDVPLESLGFLAAGAFARRETVLLESEHIAARPIPVEVHIKALHSRIKNRKRMRFSELVNDDTPTPIVVVTFLAVLELYKRSMVDLEQDAQFGDIEINYIEGSGELVLDEFDAEG